MHSATDTLHCADCGRSGNQSSILLHSGAVSARGDEGHVRHTVVALCASCTALRLASQESARL